MIQDHGFTALEAVVVIAVTSSIVGLTTSAVVSFARIGRVIADTSTTVVGLAVLEKTLYEAAAKIAAPPGSEASIIRTSSDGDHRRAVRIEVPYFGGDPCSFVIVESTDGVTRVLHREGSHEHTLALVPVPVEFVYHPRDKNLVTLRARDLPRAAVTVRLGRPSGAGVAEDARTDENTKVR